MINFSKSIFEKKNLKISFAKKVDLDAGNYDAILASIPETKEYDYRDVIDVCPRSLGPDYRKKVGPGA